MNKIIRQYQHGLITLKEALDKLDALQVRGAFHKDGGFIGYDYANQVWIEVSASSTSHV